MYSMGELEDFSIEFSVDNEEELDTFESELVEATRHSDYNAFMVAYNKLKEFCYGGGPGGRFYFDDMWKDDPRIEKLKQVKNGPVYSNVVSMLRERGPSESKDIYILVEGANYKVLQSLIRKKEIQRLPCSHVYYLPEQDISGIVEDTRRREEELQRTEAEYGNDDPGELTIPPSEDFLNMVRLKAEEDLRRKGATEEQTDQIFGKKKKHKFLSIFRKK